MGELTVGEHASSYKPVNQETAKALQEKAGPSLRWRVAHKLGFAALAASLGMLGAAGAGHSPQEVVTDVATGTVDTASDFAGGLNAAGKRLDNNIKFHLGGPNQPDTNPQAPQK